MALSTEFLPYIFGPGTGETLESIAKKRQIAEALLARSGTPKNVGEGLTAVGNALASVILERRAAAGEKAGQAGVDPNGLVAKWLSGGDLDEITSGAPSPVPGVPPSPAPVVPSPSIARPPSAGPVENVPAGWGAGGSFAPPAGAPSAAAPTAGVASPTGFSGSKQAFVQMMMPAAIELSKKTGLDPRLIVAQAAQETGFGQHAPGGNYFGIKSHGVPGGQTLRTTEFAGGQPHAENASFRTYSGPEASVRGYGDFLQQNPRYAPMLAAQGLDAQLAALGKSGYATDPNYAASVGAIARGIPQGGPTQVASLDPSVGLPPPPTAVQKVAAAMPGAPSAGPEMANAGMPPVSGPGMLPPPFVPPSVPTGVMPTRGVQSVAGALAPPAPPPVAPMQPPQGAPPAGGTRAPSPAVVRQALENLNNPFANAGVKAQAMEVLKRADPSYQLEQKMKEAQYQNLVNPKPTPYTDLAKAKRDLDAGLITPDQYRTLASQSAEGKSDETFGFTPIPYQDPAKWAPGGRAAVEGDIRFGQLGNKGTFKTIPLPAGARPAPTTREIRTDTEVITEDIYGNVLTRRPLNVEEAARQKARGAAAGALEGTAFAGLEPAIIAADSTIKDIDALIANPGLGGITGGPLGLALNQFKPTFQMSPEENKAYTQLEQLQGKAFLEARAMLKGGGQITDYEGGRAERAMTRMSRALSKEDFIDALNEFKDAVKTGVEKIRAAAKTTPSARTPTPAPDPGAPAAALKSPPLEGIRAVNPTTGEKLILKNGQWVPDNG